MDDIDPLLLTPEMRLSDDTEPAARESAWQRHAVDFGLIGVSTALSVSAIFGLLTAGMTPNEAMLLVLLSLIPLGIVTPRVFSDPDQ